MAGRNAVVVGGANSAGQAALFLARHADQVHVLTRRDNLRDTMSNYLAQRLTHHERVTAHPRSELSAAHGTDRLNELTWRDHALERDVQLDAAGLFLMIGADPCTTWLHEVGVELDPTGSSSPTTGSRRRCPECSPSETCAPGPSSAWPRPSARDPR